jgi:hypothetical protein
MHMANNNILQYVRKTLPRARICKCSRSPGIDSARLYVAWRAGTITLLVPESIPWNRFLDSLYKFGLRHFGCSRFRL